MHVLIRISMYLKNKSGYRGYKTFFTLISAEHEIFSAHKDENAKKSWDFHIY